jgi:hypothetical protein
LCVADFARFPTDADERRDAFLVSEADAAVSVGAPVVIPDYFGSVKVLGSTFSTGLKSVIS